MEYKTFCLRWNQHQEHLMSSLIQMLATKDLVDVSILCTQDYSGRVDRTFQAHKVKKNY